MTSSPRRQTRRGFLQFKVEDYFSCLLHLRPWKDGVFAGAKIKTDMVFGKVWQNWLLVGVLSLILAILALNFGRILGEVSQGPFPKGKIGPVPTGIISPAPTGEVNEKAFEINGIVQRSDIEGGCWSIQPEFPECKGDKCPLSAPMGMPANYEPINFPKELQKTGLKAKFKLEVQSGVATICQIGPAVKILDYEILK